MNTIHVDVVSAEESIFSGEARFVALPGEAGELGIYPRHTPLITRIKTGSVRIELPDGTEEFVFVAGGILEVQPNCVTVLSDTAIRGSDLDDQKAQEAKAAAERAHKRKDQGFMGEQMLTQYDTQAATAKARMEQANAARDANALRLANGVVRATADGTISRVNAVAGSIVPAGTERRNLRGVSADHLVPLDASPAQIRAQASPPTGGGDRVGAGFQGEPEGVPDVADEPLPGRWAHSDGIHGAESKVTAPGVGTQAGGRGVTGGWAVVRKERGARPLGPGA